MLPNDQFLAYHVKVHFNSNFHETPEIKNKPQSMSSEAMGKAMLVTHEQLANVVRSKKVTETQSARQAGVLMGTRTLEVNTNACLSFQVLVQDAHWCKCIDGCK